MPTLPPSHPPPYPSNVTEAGPRICLGMNMAYFEAKLLIVTLLQRFDFELCPGQDIRYLMSVTLNMNGMVMKPTSRTNIL
jgi:cytochrome P450